MLMPKKPKKKALKKKEEKYVQVCPKCGSVKIRHGFSQAAGAVFGVPDIECLNCGHTSKVFPKIPVSKVKEPKKPKDVKGRHLVNKSIGMGLIGVWVIIGIFGIIFSLGTILFMDSGFIGWISLILAILATIYSFYWKKDKEKTWMKVIFWIILILMLFSLFLSYFFLSMSS